MAFDSGQWAPRVALVTWLLVLSPLLLSAYLRHSHVGTGCTEWPKLLRTDRTQRGTAVPPLPIHPGARGLNGPTK